MTKKYKFNIFLGPLPLLDSVGTVHNWLFHPTQGPFQLPI
jgi:hypothetical protein